MSFLPEAFQLLAFLVQGYLWPYLMIDLIFSVSIWPSQSTFCCCCGCFVCWLVCFFFVLVCSSYVFPDISPESLYLINNSRHMVLWSQRNVSSLVSVEFLCVFSVSFVLVEIKNYRHFSNLLKRWAQACGCCLSFPTVAGIWFSCFILCLLIGAFFRFSLNGFSF